MRNFKEVPSTQVGMKHCKYQKKMTTSQVQIFFRNEGENKSFMHPNTAHLFSAEPTLKEILNGVTWEDEK